MNQIYLYIWLGVMVSAIAASTFYRRAQGKKAADSRDFVAAAFALGGAITLTRILLKVITEESLQVELEWDGTIALCISSGLGIQLSLKEFFKLLF